MRFESRWRIGEAERNNREKDCSRWWEAEGEKASATAVV